MARISLVPQNKQFFRLLERASDNAVGIARELVRGVVARDEAGHHPRVDRLGSVDVDTWPARTATHSDGEGQDTP